MDNIPDTFSGGSVRVTRPIVPAPDLAGERISGALPIPESERRQAIAPQNFPSRRGSVVLLDVLKNVLLQVVSVGDVCARVRVPKVSGDCAGPFGHDLQGSYERDVARDRGAL